MAEDDTPEKPCDFNFKLILVGNSGVGKTCVIRRFTTGAYNTYFAATNGRRRMSGV